MDDYIGKPVKQETLAAAIERWTLNRGSSREGAGISEKRSSAGVIDFSVIAELRGLRSSTNPDFFNLLIDLFIEETPHRLEAIRVAIKGSDPAAVAQQSHALKGSSAHLGAVRLAELCAILEEQGRAGSIGGAPALFSGLEEEFASVREALEREKKKM